MTMSPEDIAAIQGGIFDAGVLFFTIAGSILVVLASCWGFGKVTGLLGGGSGWTEESESQYDYAKVQAGIDEREGFINRGRE